MYVKRYGAEKNLYCLKLFEYCGRFLYLRKYPAKNLAYTQQNFKQYKFIRHEKNNIRSICNHNNSFFRLLSACNKKVKRNDMKNQLDNKAGNEINKREINYTPKDKKEGHLFAMKFVNATAFSKKQTRTSFSDIGTDEGAWAFEASANYLENMNAVFTNMKSSITITIAKTSSGLLSGSSLTNNFNEFISTIESSSFGFTPRIIDITILSEDATNVKLVADVYGDTEPLGSVTFPNTDQYLCDAASILNSAIDYYIATQYAVGTPPNWACGFYFQNVNGYFQYGHAYQTDGFLENKLWICQIANGTNTGPFKYTDFQTYFDNYQDIANNPVPVTQQSLIDITFACDYLNGPGTPFLFVPALYPQNASPYNGYQHCISGKMWGYFITY